jgi:hypothetical protein
MKLRGKACSTPVIPHGSTVVERSLQRKYLKNSAVSAAGTEAGRSMLACFGLSSER